MIGFSMFKCYMQYCAYPKSTLHLPYNSKLYVSKKTTILNAFCTNGDILKKNIELNELMSSTYIRNNLIIHKIANHCIASNPNTFQMFLPFKLAFLFNLLSIQTIRSLTI